MIAKIELIKPEEMAIAEVKDELIMRLHDAFLLYREDQAHGASKAFGDAENAVKDGDWAEGFRALSPWLDNLRLSQFENASRMDDLFERLIKWKNEPQSSALVAPEQLEVVDVEMVDEFGMSQEEVERLVQLEYAIKVGVEGFRLAGEALREIRDTKLYKQYGTFEQYCEKKWKFTKTRAYQLMDAEKTVNNLLTAGINPEALPVNEAQVRALSALPEDRQVEVWSEAKAAGKVTAARIKAIASGGSALTLTPSPSPMGGEGGKSSPDVWNPNLWETPTHIAKAMAMILNEDEALILEPCAGTGQIARAIADIRDLAGWDCELMAIEILKERSEKLEDNRYFSIDADFIDFDFGDQRFDAVVTNPPFDIGLDILEKSLLLLKSGGRCLFLLPIAYFQTQERAKKFATFNAHIHGIYPIVGRVAYLKNGIPETGRQCDDAIFDVRLGADCEGGMEFIWQ